MVTRPDGERRERKKEARVGSGAGLERERRGPGVEGFSFSLFILKLF